MIAIEFSAILVAVLDMCGQISNTNFNPPPGLHFGQLWVAFPPSMHPYVTSDVFGHDPVWYNLHQNLYIACLLPTHTIRANLFCGELHA